jgi:cell division protein FtsB
VPASSFLVSRDLSRSSVFGKRLVGAGSARGFTYMVSVFAQRVLPLLVLAVAVVSVPFLMLSPSGLPRLRNLEEERRRANEEISRLGSQITALRAEVSRIKSDPAAVERAARDELGLVRTTEVVFQFSE